MKNIKQFFIIKSMLILLAFITAILWSYILPYNEGPDEFTHFEVSQFISDNNRFPIFGVDHNMTLTRYEIPGVVLKQNASYSAMPPLSYIWQAIFIKILPFDNNFGYLSARFAQNILMIFYALVIFKIAKYLFKSKILQYLFFSIAVFTPAIVFTFSYVNSDAMLLVFSSLIWLEIFILVKSKTNISNLKALYLGLILGLSTLTRYNIFPLLLIWGGVMLYKIYKYKLSWLRLFFVGGVGLLISVPWYLRNLILYHDLLASHQFWQEYYNVFPRGSGDTIWQIIIDSNWWLGNLQTLVGSFGWNILSLSNSIYQISLLIFSTSIFFVINNFYKIKNKTYISIIFIVFNLSLILSIYQSSVYAYQPQARYLYSAWIFFPLIITLAISLYKKYYKVLSIILIFSLLVLQVYVMFGIIIPYYF